MSTQVQESTFKRTRVNITGGYFDDGYGTPIDTTMVRPSETGRYLSSLLPDGSHAPVLDVDYKVTVEDFGEGSSVTVYGKFNIDKITGPLQKLVESKDLHRKTLEYLERSTDEAYNRVFQTLRRAPYTTQVTLVFPYPVLAPVSRSGRHHHLLCQKSMPWDQARELAYLLSCTGVVDTNFEKISSKSFAMMVYLA